VTTIKSNQRVADHGEVFTPSWLVEATGGGLYDTVAARE